MNKKPKNKFINRLNLTYRLIRSFAFLGIVLSILSFSLGYIFQISFELGLIFFSTLFIVGISIKILFFKPNSKSFELFEIIRWIKKPIIVLLFTLVSVWLNLYGHYYSDPTSIFSKRLFESITSAIKFLSGEFRVDNVLILMNNSWFYEIVFYLTSLAAFSFTLIIVLTYLFESLFNSYLNIRFKYNNKRLLICGSKEEILDFVSSLYGEELNEINHIEILLPNIEKYDISELKLLVKSNLKAKKTFSFHFKNIGQTELNDIFISNNQSDASEKSVHLQVISLFKDINYQLKLMRIALNLELKDISVFIDFYIRADFIKDTNEYFNHTNKNNKKNVKIFTFSESNIISNDFIKKYSVFRELKDYSIDKNNKTKTNLNFLFVGINDNVEELVKIHLINYNFPQNDGLIFNIKTKFSVFHKGNMNERYFSEYSQYKYFQESDHKSNQLGSMNYLNTEVSLIPDIQFFEIANKEENYENKVIQSIRKSLNENQCQVKTQDYFQIIVDLETDAETLRVAKKIETLLNREYFSNNFKEVFTYKIYCLLENIEVENSVKESSMIVYFGDKKSVISYERVINRKVKEVVEKIYKCIQNRPISDMTYYDYYSTEKAFYGLNTKLNLLKFQLYEKPSNLFSKVSNSSKDLEKNDSCLEEFYNFYMDKSNIADQKKTVEKIKEYKLLKASDYRNKLAYLEHSRWNATMILTLSYFPMSIEHYTVLLKENIYKKYIDVANSKEKKRHICLTPYENVFDIAGVIEKVKNSIEEENLILDFNINELEFRYDYYFKDFLFLDNIIQILKDSAFDIKRLF